MAKDYYRMLGVPKNATEVDLRIAYRLLSMEACGQHWSDKTPDEKALAKERFRDLTEAYGVLGSPGKRQQYDQLAERLTSAMFFPTKTRELLSMNSRMICYDLALGMRSWRLYSVRHSRDSFEQQLVPLQNRMVQHQLGSVRN